MSHIVLESSPTGAADFILTAPDDAAIDRKIILPDRSGTLAMDGPVVSAYQNAPQALAANVMTKILFQIVESDPAGAFANSRFQPGVAGWYLLLARVQAATAFSTMDPQFAKNGIGVKNGAYGQNIAGAVGSALVYLNGITDYIEFFCSFSTSQNTIGSNIATYFQAVFVRP